MTAQPLNAAAASFTGSAGKDLRIGLVKSASRGIFNRLALRAS
jgi:hypothetical protein